MKNKCWFLFPLLMFTGCGNLPQLYQAAEDIADDNALRVEIQKEAIQSKANISICVDVNPSQ